jgi:uncharacterized membrane protein
MTDTQTNSQTPAPTPAPHDDAALDAHIGLLLRTGTLSSAAVILAGGILYLLRHASAPADYTHFHGVPAQLRTLSGIVHGTLHGDSLSIIQLGILMLIATPIARVAFSVVAFLIERDFLYVTVSAIVLAVLLYSLFWH